MYIGSNPIALHSQETIAETLITMMQEKDYSKLSVKEICLRADLSRQTFYEFFESRESVVRYCIRKRLFTIDSKIHQVDHTTITDYFERHIANNKAFLGLLARNHLGDILEEEMRDSLTELENQIGPKEDLSTKSIANAFLTAALVHSFLMWADDRVKVSEQSLIDLIYSILRGRYFKIG